MANEPDSYSPRIQCRITREAFDAAKEKSPGFSPSQILQFALAHWLNMPVSKVRPQITGGHPRNESKQT